MGRVVEDVEAARETFAGDKFEARAAYAARQQIRKTAFDDLRSACLHLGGQLTAPFLRLNKEIDDFAAQWTNLTLRNFGDQKFGETNGLLDHLERIELQAGFLRDEACNGMKRCTKLLAETERTLIP